jgi:hypothetical protein
VGDSSAGSRGHASWDGDGTTSACGTTFFEMQSKATWARGFAARSKQAPRALTALQRRRREQDRNGCGRSRGLCDRRGIRLKFTGSVCRAPMRGARRCAAQRARGAHPPADPFSGRGADSGPMAANQGDGRTPLFEASTFGPPNVVATDRPRITGYVSCPGSPPWSCDVSMKCCHTGTFADRPMERASSR